MNDTATHLHDAYFDRLGELLLDELRRFPPGRNELQLMRRLEAEALPGFTGRPEPGDSLALFRAHFLLFHALYRLRERLVASGDAGLEIHCMNSRLLPLGAGEQALAHHDPLRDYYLDLNQLAETDRAGVEAMLQGFWLRQRARERRGEALAVLELEEPVRFDEIKRQYRRLAARHHPDRGGDKARLQAINAAMSTLQKLYTP
ncbi:DNA-J related domain-containing protein [Endothiovibrio diazotrophicus]